MTRVYVVYVFGKHIHAFKLLIFSINRSVFRGRVYVWRFILKKNCIPLTRNKKPQFDDLLCLVSHSEQFMANASPMLN